MAELVVFGEPAVGTGGAFERECARTLRDHLPDCYVLATNVYLARAAGGFHECDAIVSAPGICDVLEMKCIRPEISVGEDSISSSTGFTLDRVFSTVDNKSKVLASRRGQAPFPSGAAHKSVRVGSQVVIPSDTRINFKHSAHSRVRPVQTLADTLEKYQRLAREQQDFNN